MIEQWVGKRVCVELVKRGGESQEIRGDLQQVTENELVLMNCVPGHLYGSQAREFLMPDQIINRRSSAFVRITKVRPNVAKDDGFAQA